MVLRSIHAPLRGPPATRYAGTMPPFSAKRNRIVIALLWVFLYCSFALISPPLLDDADSVHAEVAREMIMRGDPVTLYANGIRYLEKAPVLYWSMAGKHEAVFGVGARHRRGFPLALFVLAAAVW